MFTNVAPVLSRNFRRINLLLLAFSLSCGALLGTLVAALSDHSIVSSVRTACMYRVSIVDLLIVIAVPFFFLSVSLLTNSLYVLYLLCTFKVCSYALCQYCIWLTFGYSWWLVGTLLLFTDSIVLCSLVWFAVRSTDHYSKNIRRDFGIALAFCAIAGLLDYCLISPFLVFLTNR